ncbi:MAG: hypothetical protein ABID09_00495 [Candidatus Omnitrophota bacterium]
MMEDRLAAHQDPIDEFIKQNAIKAKGLSSIPYLEEEFMRCVNACGANNMLTRLKTTLTSAGGKIQVIFVKSEGELPVFYGERAWGHAGTYVTVFALESEKDSREGRRKIIARLFHEMRARSTRAKELFDEEFENQNPATPEEITAFIRSTRERFEKDNLQIQQQIEQSSRITNQSLIHEFMNLTFAMHPDIMNRDYMMAKKSHKPEESDSISSADIEIFRNVINEIKFQLAKVDGKKVKRKDINESIKRILLSLYRGNKLYFSPKQADKISRLRKLNERLKILQILFLYQDNGVFVFKGTHLALILASSRKEEEILSYANEIMRLKKKISDFDISNFLIAQMIANPEFITRNFSYMLKEKAGLPPLDRLLRNEEKGYLRFRLFLQQFGLDTIYGLIDIFAEDSGKREEIKKCIRERAKEEKTRLSALLKVKVFYEDDYKEAGLLLFSCDESVRIEVRNGLVERHFDRINRYKDAEKNSLASELLLDVSTRYNIYHNLLTDDLRHPSYIAYLESYLRFIDLILYYRNQPESLRQMRKEFKEFKMQFEIEHNREPSEQELITEFAKTKRYDVGVVLLALGKVRVRSLDEKIGEDATLMDFVPSPPIIPDSLVDAQLLRLEEELDYEENLGENDTLDSTGLTEREKPPPGSIYSIFEYLCDHDVTVAERAISGQVLAKSAGEEHEARQKALSFESIEDDLRGLLLHLHLIEKAPGSETGKDARYYVPEAVKKKSAEILPILEQFRGKDLRPAVALLDRIYEEKIKPILGALAKEDVETEKTLEQIFGEIEQAIPKNDVWSQVRVPFDPENALDSSPQQEKVVSSDTQLEFASGLLYHGRDGLDEAILCNNISGKIPLTRVAHQWATSDFSNKYQSPAIFVISTMVFNKFRDEGKATLKIVGERSHGFVDPYPEITTPLSLESVEEIWIDMDTYERYKGIVQKPSTELEKSLKPKIEHLFRIGKLKVIPYLRHTTLNEDTSFDSTLANVGRYMVIRKLFSKMPLFKEKSETKPVTTPRSTDALKALPQEWRENDLKVAEFTAELSQLLRIDNILNQDKSTFIFSEKVTFDNGLGVLLPKLVKSGMRVAVIATNDRQRALIDELNQGKPENERIVYADTVADIRTKVHTARYYYFKVTGDPDTDLQGIITFDITEIVKRIIDALGKVSGIVERERIELLHEAARKFAEAA